MSFLLPSSSYSEDSSSSSCSLLDEGVVVNFGMVKAFEAIGTLGGIKTLVVEDLTILVVVMVIGESLKLLLRLVNGGLGLIPDPDDPEDENIFREIIRF